MVEAGPKYRRERNRQQKARKSHQDINGAHQQQVGPTPEISGYRSGGKPDGDRYQHSCDSGK